MWEINSNDQIVTFLWGIVLGIALCILYDFIRAALTVKRCGKCIVFMADVFFWVITSFVVFVFLLARTNGELRGYALVSIGVGFLIFKLTISKFISVIFRMFFNIWYKILALIGDFLRRTLDKFYSAMCYIGKICKKSIKKCLKGSKKLLKNGWKMLYTRTRDNKMKEGQKETYEA
ncbi:MAG: spore cortex biosynthesis protein YabQ [Clostridia bacterium]|nr:spore cortex biosynthesis protein YabQ [Clostridia bacterium]